MTKKVKCKKSATSLFAEGEIYSITQTGQVFDRYGMPIAIEKLRENGTVFVPVSYEDGVYVQVGGDL